MSIASQGIDAHHDQLGSTRALTDVNGNTVRTYTYDPYGNVTAKSGSVTDPFGYAGQYTDAETGLQYLRARYYDPATAQFLTRDPLVNSTHTPYGYASEDPVNAQDPSGLCSTAHECGYGYRPRNAWYLLDGEGLGAWDLAVTMRGSSLVGRAIRLDVRTTDPVLYHGALQGAGGTKVIGPGSWTTFEVKARFVSYPLTINKFSMWVAPGWDDAQVHGDIRDIGNTATGNFRFRLYVSAVWCAIDRKTFGPFTEPRRAHWLDAPV